MSRKIPAQPFPFFNTVIRPVWRVMNTLIFLIAFFTPSFFSYQMTVFNKNSVNCAAPSCMQSPNQIIIPDVATVKDWNTPVVVTVKSIQKLPYANGEVYACNGQTHYSKRTDAKGQATFILSPGSYRFRAGDYDAQYCSPRQGTLPYYKTYNGFEAVELLWIEGFEVESISLLMVLGVLCGVYSLVSAVAIFAKHARYTAFIPLVIGAAGVIMFAISFMQSAGWGERNAYQYSLLGRVLYDGYLSYWSGDSYWFILIGLVSSAAIEFIEWMLIGKFNEDMTAKIISLAFTSFLGAMISLLANFFFLRVFKILQQIKPDNIGQAVYFLLISAAIYITIFITLHTLIGISFSFIGSSIQTDSSRLNRAETILYSALSSSGSYLLVMLFFFWNLFSASFNANTRISSGWLILGVPIGLLCATLLGAAGGRLTVKWRTKVQEA